jgi:hypothetical protein
MTRIQSCDCKHKFQDERYGKGMRVHNVTSDGGARCTVCGVAKQKGGK